MKYNQSKIWIKILIITISLLSLTNNKRKNNSKFRFPKLPDKKLPKNECFLAARVFPFKYISSKQTMELKMEFKSNCMDFSNLSFFILPYDRELELTKVVHPKLVILSIFNRIYKLDFTNPEGGGSGKMYYIQYNEVVFTPTRWLKPTNINQDNTVWLRTTILDQYQKEEMDQLLLSKNPSFCKISSDKKTMYCQIE